jgi:hypothetical protein
VSKVAFLLVTCCREETRSEILKQVIDSINAEAPELKPIVTVFDNASTVPGTMELLKSNFTNVYQSDKNVGYWSAIDWWLERLAADPPTYTYILESDMIYYDFHKLWKAVDYLDVHPETGSVRTHQYSVENKHLFNKDVPRPDSKRNYWQSHTNRVTGQPVVLEDPEDGIWSTTFLTQLPSLNRYEAMRVVFEQLRGKRFTEHDFQHLYWNFYRRTGIIDGGIFHCDLNHYGIKSLTGSWSPPEDLQRVGYQATRFASLVPQDQYTVVRG